LDRRIGDHPVGSECGSRYADLRRRLAGADAVLFCTPECAGSLPGSFKNLLDWTVGGGETYGTPVAWINASSRPDPDAGSGANEALRTVLGYTGADIVAPACRRIQVRKAPVGAAVGTGSATPCVTLCSTCPRWRRHGGKGSARRSRRALGVARERRHRDAVQPLARGVGGTASVFLP